MYGLIHSAVKQLVLDNYDEETWHKVMVAAGNPDDAFLTMRFYDDEVTMRIVTAAAETLEVSIEQCLEVFGGYWMVNFAPDNYGSLLDHGGENVAAFLSNLDDMHDHISTSFTEFLPPSFKVNSADSNEIKLTYRSERNGLTPFVRGIFLGMKQRFKQNFTLHESLISSDHTGEVTDFSLRFEE